MDSCAIDFQHCVVVSQVIWSPPKVTRHFVCNSRGALARTRLRALIADADDVVRPLISRHLLSAGFDVVECSDGRQVLERVTAARFELIVLDGALPGFDGIALCRLIRQRSANAASAIIILAASSTESDTVLALLNGADDCMTKPLSVREFLARVSAIMRRARRATYHNEKSPIDRLDIRLDPSRRQVTVRGSVVACSKQEFGLLYALASSPGIVFTREQLVTQYWCGRPDPSARLVDPIISRLRNKIERDPSRPKLIITVWGRGYKFVE